MSVRAQTRNDRLRKWWPSRVALCSSGSRRPLQGSGQKVRAGTPAPFLPLVFSLLR